MDSTENKLKLSIKEDEDCQFAMELARSSVLPMVLKTAIELDVLEILARAGPGMYLSSSEITSDLPTKNPDAPIMLDRILTLLVSYSVLKCSLLTHDNGQVQRKYGLGPASKYFVENQNGVSLSPLLHLIQDKVLMETRYHLKDAILEGGLPFNKAHGRNASEYVGTDTRFGKIFSSSMVDYNSIFVTNILEVNKGFEGLKELVDVGGGDATILRMIISKNPEIKGINFDLPQVIETCAPYPGVEHIAGDMFESVPKGDAIFMKWILHGWNDEQCLKILKNCYEAISVNGKVIVVELVVPAATETSNAAKSIFQFDIFLMNMNPNGKERTEKEFEVLAKEAGFAGVRVACCAFNFSVIEFYKNL